MPLCILLLCRFSLSNTLIHNDVFALGDGNFNFFGFLRRPVLCSNAIPMRYPREVRFVNQCKSENDVNLATGMLLP